MDPITHLDFDSEVQDITLAVTARVEQVMDELLDRLEEHPSDRDTLALAQALTNAARAGSEEARAAIRACLLREGITMDDPLSLPVVDIWAERYGDDSDEAE